MATPLVNGTVTTHTSTAVTSDSFSHPVNTGLTNSMLVVFVNDRAGYPALTCSYNGVAMADSFSGVDAAARSYNVFTLASPASGTNTVALTWASTDMNSGAITVCTLTNVGAFDDGNTETGSSTSPTVTVDTNANNDIVFQAVYNVNETVTAVESGQTEISNITSGAYHQEVSYIVDPTSGGISLTATLSSAESWLAVGASIKYREGFVPSMIII